MTIFQAIILGIVQGLTELLPISSSAHLNLFPWLFNWGEMNPAFDVALHIGTLFAILVFFFKDWVKLIKGGYKQLVKKEKSTDGKIFWKTTGNRFNHIICPCDNYLFSDACHSGFSVCRRN